LELKYVFLKPTFLLFSREPGQKEQQLSIQKDQLFHRRIAATGDMSGRSLKLQEPEGAKAALGLHTSRVEEDIKALKRVLQFVATKNVVLAPEIQLFVFAENFIPQPISKYGTGHRQMAFFTIAFLRFETSIDHNVTSLQSARSLALRVEIF
jgi:hypothetical protein